MGVDLSTPRRDLIAPGAVRVVQRSTATIPWWLLGIILLAATYVPLLTGAGTAAVRQLPWVVSPLVGAAGWGYAARRALSRPRLAFLALGSAGVFSAAAEIVWMYERYAWPTAGMPVAMYLFLLPPLLITGGAVMALGQRRESVWTPSLKADALLLLLAALVVTLRLVVEPLLGVGVAHTAVAALALAYTVAVVPALLSALVLLRGTSTLAPSSAVLLFLATALFACATLSSLAGFDPHPLQLGDGVDYVLVLGWLLFAGAGYRARKLAATASGMTLGRRIHAAVRMMIVPGATLLLGAAVVDMALRSAPSPATVASIGLLALVLAVRTGQALSAADRGTEQRRQLAHTQALVAVSHSLAGTTELDTTLQLICEAARRVFRTRAAGIELLSEDGRALETRAVVGMPEQVMELRFPLEGSFTGWVVVHGEPRATVDPTRDPYIQPESLAFLGRWPVAAAPIRFREETLGALFACIRSDPFEAEELHLLGAMAEQAAIAIENARLFEQVRTLSVTDPLTGLANRRQLELELAREFAAARRGRRLVAVIFDLDDFKAYNDAHGHLAGDAALAAFGCTLRDETRTMNLAARYGGDEFVVLLSGTDLAGGHAYVKRVRFHFGEAVRALGRGPIGVSAGVAVYSDDLNDPDDLLRRADAALYSEKPRVGT